MNPVPSVLVTGASRGLGRGIAIEAAKQGLSVAINFAADARAADDTAATCRSLAAGPEQRFVTVHGDIGQPDARVRILEHTLAGLGRVDALVNNAGIAPRVRADVTAMTEASFEEVVRTNLQGPFFLTQAVANHWLSEPYAPALPGGFKIVFITSISSDTASVSRGEYCMSKAALAMASQLWAVRLADRGIQVIDVRPGIMATDMTSAVKEKYDSLLAQGLVPQKRWGSAEDVGRAVRAILAGDFQFTTGTTIHVDGGFRIRRL